MSYHPFNFRESFEAFQYGEIRCSSVFTTLWSSSEFSIRNLIAIEYGGIWYDSLFITLRCSLEFSLRRSLIAIEYGGIRHSPLFVTLSTSTSEFSTRTKFNRNVLSTISKPVCSTQIFVPLFATILADLWRNAPRNLAMRAGFCNPLVNQG